jgi:archaemetzincin
MQGTNGAVEVLSQPLHLCPVCLHKLQYATKCNLLERYQRLVAFYAGAEEHFEKEKTWMEARLESLTPKPETDQPKEEEEL